MVLDLNCAFRGSQGAGELSQRTITSCSDESSLVAGKARLDQFPFQPFELGVGGFLACSMSAE